MSANVRRCSVNSARPTVGACMIVKNEEENLPRCLRSIRDYVDEIVVVDTGSTDGTAVLAESFGARVFHHPWENDFSKHRNQSIAYSGSDWIFIIDADEELIEGGELLRQVVDDGTTDSFLVTVVSYRQQKSSQSHHNSVRLFRNNGRNLYRGIVHNRLVGPVMTKMTSITLNHYGYDQGEEMNQAKFERTAALLKQNIASDPGNPLPHHYLTASYMTVDRYDEAIESGTAAIDLAEEKGLSDPIYLWTHYLVGAAYYATKRYRESEDYCRRALSRYPDHLDSWYIIALVAFEERRWTVFLQAVERCRLLIEAIISEPMRFGAIVNENAGNHWKLTLLEGFYHYLLGSRETAVAHYDRAVEYCPTPWKCHKSIGIFHQEENDFAFAEKHLLLAREASPRDIDVLYGLARLFGKTGRGEEKKEVLRAFCEINPDFIDVAFELAVMELSDGNASAALSLLEGVIAKRPNFVEALVNSGLALALMGRTEEALSAYRRALGADPSSLEGLTNLGHLLLRLRRFTEARAVLERARSIDGALSDVRTALSLIYLNEQDFDSLVAECDELLTILDLPRNRRLDSLADLGDMYGSIAAGLERSERTRSALMASEIAWVLTDKREYLENCGHLRARLGDYREAAEALEKLLARWGGDQEIFAILGDCYENLGAAEAAALCREQLSADCGAINRH
ncbi:MAG: tetratricopeptide repeat protein [Deltaproteobacteria bacterium]|nr:tetratricopeptide repeat protein [Deltaproteobacteria bacterium]